MHQISTIDVGNMISQCLIINTSRAPPVPSSSPPHVSLLSRTVRSHSLSTLVTCARMLYKPRTIQIRPVPRIEPYWVISSTRRCCCCHMHAHHAVAVLRLSGRQAVKVIWLLLPQLLGLLLHRALTSSSLVASRSSAPSAVSRNTNTAAVLSLT
jgi:hypothetical protein